ncbi:AAA family ATPase [Xanthomonas campestris pv. raphani]|uniref:AAA family ATPase n=1 Tax=Pseudomonadota TaxID=1224 RepID=UPI0023680D16|nr:MULTISPECIES: AAA family ATPase [Pseudomonadota]MEA9822444.1 AAA family ATPase [Xanthomonas campestris pv. raphani]MEA9850823.1 AAA family ATPase [Xanthomonas campestris pv. raphani]MEA9854996.1 AAA family ATPase [Xanthomonas campestris pv. raphani]MEA9963887.1 AAA family ATPase [Xanthomonas campestris pv. raphani]WDJ24283.1 AAA family ATPase [Xanthomonas campestris pv. raphani]
MRFVVEFREGDSPTTNRYPHAVLVQDNWDDYGYKSTFQVTLHLSATEVIELGSIKIIQGTSTGGYTKMPRESFAQLPEGHASLGADLEYYETLYKLGPDVFRPYLKGLRDVAFNDEAKANVEDSEGYRVSMLRFSGAERTIADATRLLRATTLPTKRRSAGFRVKFKTRVASNSNSFTVQFDFRRRGILPNRINALIGYNGTGKTRLLSNLAIVASGYGYSTKEDVLQDAAGRFVGTAPPFKTVVVISYSAFDTFVIPGQNQVEKDRLQHEGELFGYVYCGLRERSGNAMHGEQTYRLKTPAEIQVEFLSALSRVREAERLQNLLDVLKPLLRDPSFQRIGLTQLYANYDDDDISGLFQSLSSGHKVVLKIVTELTAHISGSEPTLVLIDEPETHLHPPLLAAFLKSVRACLEIFDGYAIIATHSPVVLQETPSKYVRVLRRAADQNRIVAPAIETFAETIGVITQEVFNLGDGSTDWHETLKTLARRNTLNEIEEMFGTRLGFTARSYVLSIRDDIEG